MDSWSGHNISLASKRSGCARPLGQVFWTEGDRGGDGYFSSGDKGTASPRRQNPVTRGDVPVISDEKADGDSYLIALSQYGKRLVFHCRLGLRGHSGAFYCVPEVKVQVLMFWMAVDPPVPPVKPT